MLTSGPCKVLPTASIYFVFTFVTRICLPPVLTKRCLWQSFASCLPLFHGNHLLRVYLCSSDMLASGLCKVLSTANICFVFTFVPRESFTSCLSLSLGHVHLWSLLPTSQTIHCCQVNSVTVTQECLKQPPRPITTNTPPPPQQQHLMLLILKTLLHAKMVVD